MLSAEAEIILPDLPNYQYQAKSKAISFFAKLLKFSAIFSTSTKTAKPSQSILVPSNLRSGVVFFLFIFFLASLLLWLEKEKITPDTFI